MCLATRLERRLANQRHVQTRRIWIITAAILIFVLAAGVAYVWLGGGLSKFKRTGGLLHSPHKVNILVLGVDERSDDVGRSDTMFLVTIDTDTQEVAMLSVPRDTRVKIPGFGWDKINHAYAQGKANLSLRAAEGLLGIPLDYYVLINFAGFYQIVDAVGGVDIDVEKRMYYQDPYDDLVINLKPGMQHMDGKTAIKYVRYRDSEGDIGRVERQQKFIKAMLQQVASPGVITRIPSIIKEVSATVQTNFSTSDMLSLAKVLNDAQKQGLKTDMVPGKPAFISEISYWLPDVVALRQHIAQIQGGTLDGAHLAEAEQLADEYTRSVPREMKIVEVPKAAQATVKPGATDKPTDKPVAAKSAKPPVAGKVTISVVNASGNPKAGDKMATALKAQGFEVTGVVASSTIEKDTVVICYTTSSTVINKLTGLPFRYALQVTKDDAKSPPVTVIIGKDYN